MKETADEREKKRQRLERRKKRHRKLMIQRAAIIAAFLLLLFCLIKLVGGVIRTIQSKQIEATESVQESKDTNNQISIMSQDATVVTMPSEALQIGDLILVNEECPLRSYDQLELVNVVEHNEGLYPVKSDEVMLQAQALKAFNEMMVDFNKVCGENDLGLVSGYRTYEEQERLHYTEVTEHTNEDTDSFVAKPDRSEHHTGLAIDLGLYFEDGMSGDYDGTGIYSWIPDHCEEYGFIVRYQQDKNKETGIGNEPWHLRYIGKPHAAIMKELNLCLEEYITYLKSYRYYSNPLQGGEGAGMNYAIYYVPVTGEVTEIPVPKSKAYTISGNNKDGFIVTVPLK